MRQLLIEAPQGRGRRVLEIAKDLEGRNLALTRAETLEGPTDLAVVHVPNAQVEGFMDRLDEVEGAHITLLPYGVLTLRPPRHEAAEQVLHVQHLSPIEVFLSGLQSVGTWIGLLGYAAAAGAVVWIGLFTETWYLLTAAMLIAPFAGPAMNAAIATARGDLSLLGRSVARYAAGLAVTILIAWLLSLTLGLRIPTNLMVEISQLSSVAVLLPLAAGAAGALHLMQSERDSLVSGAAVGVLVAASLAPPAGLVGMCAAIGRWDMAISSLFLLLLQLVGINLTATLVFRLYGLSSSGPRYSRGRRWGMPAVLALTAAALAGLLAWQFSDPPAMQRSTRAQRIAAEARAAVDGSGLAHLVEADLRFTRAETPGQEVLLGVVYVQPSRGAGSAGDDSAAPDASGSDDELRRRLTRLIQQRIVGAGYNVTPLVDVTVLHPPPDARAR